jgi:RHS repeat-associated protein
MGKGAVGATQTFTYDGADVLLDDSFGVQTKYLNGLGIDNKLRQTANGQTQYFLADHLGSTNALTDNNGAVVSQTAYDSFGNQTQNLTTRYGYTGRERDDFTGLMHYRARWYSPDLGRFISQDPIGFRGGDVNLFAYVMNNPLKFTDPKGLSPNSTPNGCDTPGIPKSWCKKQFNDVPYTTQNPFTSTESGDICETTRRWNNGDYFGAFGYSLWNGLYNAYNTGVKPLLGDLSIRGVGKGLGGVPGEAINTLELGPDLYNTLDTADRRNQDVNDAIRCAQGNCQPSNYNQGSGLGWW